MIQELFVNACILITVIFVTSQIFRNSGISIISPIRVRTVLGVLGGISACILIHFSINITTEVILDFRDICLILVAIFGGIFSSLITGLITAVFRLTYQGINQASIISAIIILVECIVCGIIAHIEFDIKTKCKVLLLFTLFSRSIFYIFLLGDKKNIITLIISSWISTVILALGVFYFVQYLVDNYKMLKNLKKESSLDFLTGLSNIRQFEKQFNTAILDTLETRQKLSLLIIDLDHFKRVNDTYGHAAGDVVLKGIGKLLKTSCKDHYLISRIGGEEFAIAFKTLDKKEVLSISEQIRLAVESQRFLLSNNKKINITISIGVAIYPDTVDDINNLREIADKKLYQAKWSGRNRVCI